MGSGRKGLSTINNTEKFNWKNIASLSSLENKLKNYSIISCDIFDTLLHRTHGTPQDLFADVGKRLCDEVNNFPYLPITYKNLRKEAEQRAYADKKKRTGNPQCGFSELISMLPFNDETKNKAGELEIECEYVALYLNPYISSLLNYCYNIGIKIILVSDMYHSKEQISSFLSHSGFDISILSDLLVSCEWRCSKGGEGKLFQVLLERYPDVTSDKILHIGDNPRADIIGAKSVGIKSFLYNPVFCEFCSIYDYEKYLYNVQLSELQSLRRLATASFPVGLNEEENDMFKIGAEIIGPIYSLFAEWLLDYASNNDIQRIVPFMREGELLSIVINNAINNRHLLISSEPLFVSRRPVFVASIYNSNYAERISQSLLRADRLVEEICGELGFNIQNTILIKFKGLTLRKCRENGALQAVKNFFEENSVKNQIIGYAKTQRSYLLRYLRSIAKDERIVTVDIGTKGTTESYLHTILKNENSQLSVSHALLMGSSATNIANILNGLPIVAWLGIAGENEAEVNRIKYQIQIIESIVNASCGTVMCYEEKEGNIKPVLSVEKMSDSQKNKIAKCWEGVKTFQTLWFHLSEQKPNLYKKLLEKRKSFLGILLRLIQVPMVQEAEHIGSMLYSDNYNYSRTLALCPLDNVSINLSNDNDVEEFLNSGLTQDLLWPQATITLKSQEYNVKKLLKNMLEFPLIEAMIPIFAKIKANNLKKIIIFGASELGISFVKMATILKIQIVCFVDSNINLHGMTISGLRVCPLTNINKSDIEAFVIASYTYKKEIQSIIEHYYSDTQSKPLILVFGNN